jgi:cytochrome c553
MMASTISGLPTSTKTESTIEAPTCSPRAEVEPRAERDEEEQQQEVAQAGEPRRDRLAERRRGERDAGEQPAELLAEPDMVAIAASSAAQPMAKPASSSARAPAAPSAAPRRSG